MGHPAKGRARTGGTAVQIHSKIWRESGGSEPSLSGGGTQATMHSALKSLCACSLGAVLGSTSHVMRFLCPPSTLNFSIRHLLLAGFSTNATWSTAEGISVTVQNLPM